MIFVDSNIPMYLVGADHPNKAITRRLLEDAIVGNEPLATDAEVFQELLNRYTAMGRPDAIEPAFEVLLGIVDVVHPVEFDDVEKARHLLEATPRLSARDAVHGAVMRRHDITRILTFDAGFDAIDGVERIRP